MGLFWQRRLTRALARAEHHKKLEATYIQRARHRSGSCDFEGSELARGRAAQHRRLFLRYEAEVAQIRYQIRKQAQRALEERLSRTGKKCARWSQGAGFVYAFSNRAWRRILKFGKTADMPPVRADALSSHSGVPFPYLVEFAFAVVDILRAEKMVHAYLSKFRVNRRREFFKISTRRAYVEIAALLRHEIIGIYSNGTLRLID